MLGLFCSTLMASVVWVAAADNSTPIGVIFDTDVGNDIDDALAMSVLHALESRGECRLLAVTITKDNPYAAAFVDLVNTFYGRPDIPVGIVKDGKTPEVGSYLKGVVTARSDEKRRFPHDLTSDQEAPDAVLLLRRVLASQPDDSAVLIQVGFSTNVARLLDSPPDSISDLSGVDLVKAKCPLLSIMAGNFGAHQRNKEYNVFIDAPAARDVFAKWPTSIVASGYEIGREVLFPASSIESDFRYAAHHPVVEAYRLYGKMPYDRETWDLTSVLYAVRPSQSYFGVSDPGSITVDERDVTQFTFEPSGRHRFLTMTPEQAIRVREALIQLASQPPSP